MTEATGLGIDLISEIIKVQIPQKGQEELALDPAKPALWNQQTKLDDAGAVCGTSFNGWIRRQASSPTTSI